MRRSMDLLWIVLGVVVGLPSAGEAAGSPVVDALAQGAVMQWSGKEAVSQPFAFDVTIATNDKTLNLALAVGQPISLMVAPGRVVSGMVDRVEQIDGAGAQGLYRIRLTPSLTRLKYRTTSRTFYGKSVPDLATMLLAEAGVTNVDMRLSASFPPQELTVQYQESDLVFLSRLLEEAGIHYHFEGEKVVLGDANAGFPVSPVGKVTFATAGGPSVFSFTRGQSVHAGQVQAGDYNWKTPVSDLSATAQAPLFGDLAERVFPAGIDTKAEAQTAANVRLGARVAEAQVCGGESTYPQLQAGQRVVLTGHPRADFNQEYLVTAVEHQKTGKEYRNTFSCLPMSVVFRPSLATPWPVVPGVVPAIVVGPPGESKYVDQYGRVKVRFPWRSPGFSTANDPGDGGFLRVAQIASGIGTTAMWLPDVGDEVLVAFEHGNPNRPVVIGNVYNAKDMPPVALPANKQLSILRHQTTGGAKTEVVYDGTPGSERLLIQSGQNGLTLAGNGVTIHGPAVTISSTGDLVERAGRGLVVDAGTDLTLKAGQNVALRSERDAEITVGANTQLTSGGALQATAGSNAQLTVGANLQLLVGANAAVETGKDWSLRVGQNLLLQSARAARLTAGDDVVIQTARSVVVNAGAMFQFVAAQTGTLQVGEAVVTMRRDGTVDILGKDVGVKASGNLALKGAKISPN